MNASFSLKDKLTVLVSSCDTYEDLWIPFFTLFRKYWPDQDVRLLLNTETKDFSMEGLNITCVHCPDSKKYGARILYALSQVQTEYVLILLDDFFLRNTVDMDRIQEIISWMDADPEIGYFNSDCTAVYADWEVEHYPGFRRIPPGCGYVLNLQAAVWRTDVLKSYWDSDVSPWEWEAIVNVRTIKTKKKFYCTTDWSSAICDYGYKAEGMGVFRGKWVIEDVKPLFDKEGISVDYQPRGIYDPEKAENRIKAESRRSWYRCVIRCLGVSGLLYYLIHRMYYKVSSLIGREVNPDFIQFQQEKAQKKFLKENGDERWRKSV